MLSSQKREQSERLTMGLTKTDYRLSLMPRVSEVLLRNGLGKINVARTTAVLEPIATTGET
jgi:hypothetical protein